MSVYYQSDDVTLHCGDCRDVLPTLAAGSVDAVVTDPPYELGFMSQAWDAAGVAFAPDTWRAVLTVTKPGGYLLAFGGTRTYHRLTCAIEDAGWQIVDSIHWLHGQGFPKGDGQLKPAHEPIVLARKPAARVQPLQIAACRVAYQGSADRESAHPQGDWTIKVSGNPTPDAGRNIARMSLGQWEQPSGRYPPNLLLSHADGCELVGERRVKGSRIDKPCDYHGKVGMFGTGGAYRPPRGHGDADGMETVETWRCVAGCPVAELDRQSGERTSGYMGPDQSRKESLGLGGYGGGFTGPPTLQGTYGDTGTASRFFPVFRYEPKASRSDRGQGNMHPTVKPLDLCRWLVRLVTPLGGLVLDPFAGSGTTLVAARREGMRAIGIELSAEYAAIIADRLQQLALPLGEGEAAG